jgi:dTDP-4-amino-4,6-dideoxygalactose transaminase
MVERVERRLAAYLGCKHVLAVTSCTGAIHLSRLALGVEAGDEVITALLPRALWLQAGRVPGGGAHR